MPAGPARESRTGRSLAVVTDPGRPDHGPDADPRRGRMDRLLGAAAEPVSAPPPRPRTEAPPAVRKAALVVAVEAALLAVLAGVIAVLTVVSTPDSVSRAVAEVVYVGAGAAVLAAAAVGLWRVSAWARGPVIVLQILLGLVAFTTAFGGGQPLIGLPVLALVGTELYLLASPEARVAFAER